ncbi:hypothetical protein F751_6613 [Auxenochlorella protothecoides]|uniref:Rad21/Rec8-like protein N-terminal domain-containing protein n=1 Tax=Auxenochlorella protothecoides TaxID=3075 RepID=A0A087SLQ2_AUXPR|nr:hypothetical protein F751_6613 [Auxenochlorella protothecoides]KFM26656.1 hypothetical protein F751_6613 [Auxenochlorella protothecoides]
MTPQASIPIRSEVLMNPEVPQALRLQAVLAGGVVVIQHRQVTYLLDDCNDALPEMFEVPDVQMPDFPGLDWQEYGGEACVDPTPENAPQEYREWMADVGDTLAPRTLFEREQGNPLTVKSLEAPKGLEATFQHALDPSSLPGVVLHGTSWVVTPSPGRKSVPQDEAVMEAGPEQHDLAQEYGRGEPEYDAELLAGPRSSLLKRVLSSSPGSDIETERLRAALSASPGSAYQTAMLLGQVS